MCCWSNGKRRPIYAKELIDNFEDFVIKRDLEKYTNLLNIIKDDTSRPIGGLYRVK